VEVVLQGNNPVLPLLHGKRAVRVVLVWLYLLYLMRYILQQLDRVRMFKYQIRPQRLEIL
jgi:hypothetical protein